MVHPSAPVMHRTSKQACNKQTGKRRRRQRSKQARKQQTKREQSGTCTMRDSFLCSTKYHSGAPAHLAEALLVRRGAVLVLGLRLGAVGRHRCHTAHAVDGVGRLGAISSGATVGRVPAPVDARLVLVLSLTLSESARRPSRTAAGVAAKAAHACETKALRCAKSANSFSQTLHGRAGARNGRQVRPSARRLEPCPCR